MLKRTKPNHRLELGTKSSTSGTQIPSAPFHWLNPSKGGLPTFSDSLQDDLLVLLRMRLSDDDKQVAS